MQGQSIIGYKNKEEIPIIYDNLPPKDEIKNLISAEATQRFLIANTSENIFFLHEVKDYILFSSFSETLELKNTKNEEILNNFDFINEEEVIDFLETKQDLYPILDIIYTMVKDYFISIAGKPILEYFEFEPDNYKSLNIKIRIENLDEDAFQCLWKLRKESSKRMHLEAKEFLNIQLSQ